MKWMHDTIWELMHEKRESGQDKVPACGVCRDRQPSEKSMEETVETEQTEAACSEAAAADMSRTTAPEKGQEE